MPPSYNNHNAIGYVATHPPQYIPNLRVIVKWKYTAPTLTITDLPPSHQSKLVTTPNSIHISYINKDNLSYNSCEQLQQQYDSIIQVWHDRSSQSLWKTIHVVQIVRNPFWKCQYNTDINTIFIHQTPTYVWQLHQWYWYEWKLMWFLCYIMQ